MMNHSLRSLAFLLALVFMVALAACSSAVIAPPTGTPAQEEPDAIYTAAVQTVIAELTQAAASAPPPTLVPDPPTAQPPTPTPLPTDTPAPTLTPQPPTPSPVPTLPPSPTPSESDPVVSLGSPTRIETFDSDSEWSLPDDSISRMEVQDGRLQMVAFNPNYWNGWAFTTGVLDDFYLEMTAASLSCSGLDRYGLIFRAPDHNSGYLLGLSCDGRFSLWTWDGTTETYLVDWQPSPYINEGPNQTNRLGVRAEDDRLSLYANGHLLQELNNARFQSGRFGVFVGAVNTPSYTVLVDELRYWQLP